MFLLFKKSENQKTNNLLREIEKKRNEKEFKPSEKTHELDKVLKKLNENTDIMDKSIKFEKIYEEDKIIVKVYNIETGEIIRQIPSEEMMKLSRNMDEIVGILFDETV